MKVSKPLKKTAEPELLDVDTMILATPKVDNWGWLPVLSVTSAVGVFLVTLAYDAGRLEAPWGNLLFWFGWSVLFLPIAWRLFSSRPTRWERIALLIVLGIALYLVKFLQYPLYFTYFDEFTHWRTTSDIVASGHLFHQNPILPISSFYPGLEIATSALSSLTGLSIFSSGILLIGVARLVLVLALYLFYEQFSNSSRTAGIATMLYMANPAFLFFDADFSYESFALPLAIFVLFVMAFRYSGPAGRYSRHKGLILVICLGLGAVVITHHVTSYGLVLFLLLWTMTWMAVYFYQRRTQKNQVGPSPGGAALLGLVLCVIWLVYTGGLAENYLGQYLTKAVHQFTQIIISERAPRTLFQNASGFALPLWERVISLASVALMLLGLPFGLFQIWRHHRANAAAFALAAGALAYPVGQALRLTPAGAEAGNRTTEFVFVGIAFVLAIGATEFWFSHAPHWRRSAILMGVIGILCFGQLILGTGAGGPPLPGPYLVAADARSIEPEGVAAAEWAGSYLGPGHRVASDRTNMLLMATYGDEQVVKAGRDDIPVAPVFTSLHFGGAVKTLQRDKLQYLVVDRRISNGLPPYVGSYFDQPDTQPVDPAALTKFDGVENVSRVFDSGDIHIYDVEVITNGPSTTPTPESSCMAGSPAVVSSSYPKLAKLYAGTLHDIPTGLTTKISFMDIQQNQGSICGSLGGMLTKAVFSGIPMNGPFKGTITTAKQIQFNLTNATGQVAFSFDGLILSDGSIAGTYCNHQGVVTEKCSDYGLWSVSPGA